MLRIRDRRPVTGRLAVMAVGLLLTVSASAQPPGTGRATVPISRVIATFLADSGVATRGLPWTTGNDLPIAWESTGAVANSDPVAAARGVTLMRTGRFFGTAGDSVSFEVNVVATGSQLGLARLGLWIPSLEVTNRQGGGFIATREMVEAALKAEGLTLQPIKCSREKEGASYGNLIDAVRAPGKTASGLWWMWDSPRSGPTLSLTILYRRADMNEVECGVPEGVSPAALAGR